MDVRKLSGRYGPYCLTAAGIIAPFVYTWFQGGDKKSLVAQVPLTLVLLYIAFSLTKTDEKIDDFTTHTDKKLADFTTRTEHTLGDFTTQMAQKFGEFSERNERAH